MPFMIPSHVGVEVTLSSSKSTLDSIAEDKDGEEEDTAYSSDSEIIGQEVDGGIIFTFTPPPSFEGPKVDESQPIIDPKSSAMPLVPQQTSPVSSNLRSKPFFSSIPVHTTTPVKPSSTRIPRMSESPSTPSTPVKRGIPSSSLPRPSQSPVSSPKARSASFIPQPRKSQPATPPKGQSKPRVSMYDDVRFINAHSSY